MDNPARRVVLTFGPSRGLAGCCVGGGIVLALVAGFADAGGRLLVGLAAALVMSLGLYDTFVTPRLTASVDGLRVRTFSSRVDVRWSALTTVRLDQRARLGLTSRCLEIDDGRCLIVLGRHSLGREPREVYELIRALNSPNQTGPNQPSTDVR